MVIQRPHVPLQLVHIQEKYTKDGEHGFIVMPHAWQDIGGGVWEADDRYGTDIFGEAEDEGAMSGLQI